MHEGDGDVQKEISEDGSAYTGDHADEQGWDSWEPVVQCSGCADDGEEAEGRGVQEQDCRIDLGEDVLEEHAGEGGEDCDHEVPTDPKRRGSGVQDQVSEQPAAQSAGDADDRYSEPVHAAVVVVEAGSEHGPLHAADGDGKKIGPKRWREFMKHGGAAF